MTPLLPTFAEVLTSIWLDKRTGPITVHFAEGVAQQVDFPEAPTIVRLDKPRKEAKY
jgi:hypothetical protein